MKKYSLVLCLLVGTILCAGCSPAPDPALDLLDSQLSAIKIDDLTRTMEFVFSEDRFEKEQFEEKVATSLNRWAQIEAERLDTEWSLDSMAAPVVDKYRSMTLVERMSEVSFQTTDAYFLQGVAWMERLGNRLIASPYLSAFEFYRQAADDFQVAEDDTDAMTTIIGKLHSDLSAEDAKKLSDSVKLFDWIVRNIQLLPETQLTEAEASAQKLNTQESDPIAAGVPGTGYNRYPWQILLYSRGDYVERAKLFMIMLAQQGIDSVMLSVNDGSESRRPWCVGVNIGGEYYLFDTRLGFPVSSDQPGEIVTLSQARANPELLKQLDLTVDESLAENTKYWVTADQLQDLTGLVYFSPESVSNRFAQLEGKLTAQYRLQITSQPTEQVARLTKADGLKFEPWEIAFQTHQFRQAVRDAVKQASFDDRVRQKLAWFYSSEAYINDFTLYRTARAKYFNGNFETVRGDSKANAIELFYVLMYNDDTIASLGSDKALQMMLGLTQAEQSAQEFQNRIKSVQAQMALVRRDTGFFLAQCHFDNGNLAAAINWLNRMKNRSEVQRWQDGIDYLRARAHEGRREYNIAKDELKGDESVQFHGNLIRARMLGKLVDQL